MRRLRLPFKPMLLLGMPLVLFISTLLVLMPAPRALAATVTCPDGTTINNVSSSLSPQDRAALCDGHGTATCQVESFFGLVPWYAYFNPENFTYDRSDPVKPKCTGVNLSLVNSADGTPNKDNINSIWLIALAVFEDLLRIAGVLAFAFVIYGGIRYIMSQGEPENTKAARETIINAMVGAAIAMIAAVLVSFIGTSLGAK